jgi:hypothetical protein
MSGTAVIRAADAMLQALGGDQVLVMFPLVALPDDPGAQLGLADPGVQQLVLSPVAVRSLTVPSAGPRRRLEFLISSSAVAAAVVTQNVASADDFFENALGITYENEVFHIENVQTDYFGGVAYLYRVTAVE